MKHDAEAEAVSRLEPYVQRALDFAGWRLDEVSLKRVGPDLPWDYTRRATELLAGAHAVLDMGTGGGELFGELCATFSGLAVATESWDVNVMVAANHLRPRGVEVIHCESNNLPFGDAKFDLVLNRHEELTPAEVARILVPGGTVLTQQVGRNDWNELRDFFPRMTDFGDLFEEYHAGFTTSGLAVTQATSFDTEIAYSSLGDVTFMLCVAPWTIPNFEVRKDIGALLEAERRLRTPDGIVLTESRFLVEAQKLGTPTR